MPRAGCADSASRPTGCTSPAHPGLDRLAGLARPTPEALAEALGREVARPLALFTYHPPTAVEGAETRSWSAGALRATLARCGTVVATHPGLDAGRDEVLAALAAAANDPRVVVVENLGPRYPVVLAAADVVVGNSSSGVIEAASLGVPVVDVGDRQRGRLRGDNVVHADEGEAAVGAALDLALSPEHRARSAAAVNPYGDGHAAGRVVDVVRAAPAAALAKPFVDVTGVPMTAPDLEQACASDTASLREVMQVIDRHASSMSVLVDPAGRVVGVVTDGDVRRALLAGATVDDPALPHATTDPHRRPGGLAASPGARPDAGPADLGGARGRRRVAHRPAAHPVRRRRHRAAAQRRARHGRAARGPGWATSPRTRPKPLMTVGGRADPRLDRPRPGRRRHPRGLRQRQPPRRPDRGAPR